MLNIVKNFKINAYVCIFSLEDLNIEHCVEFTFLEDTFAVSKFLMLTFLECRNNSDED